VFYRIAAKRILSRVLDDVKSHLLPIQLGVGVPNGCEAIIHNLQHALEPEQDDAMVGGSLLQDRWSASSPPAALAVDFKNAFNCVSRRRVMQALYALESMKPLWRLVDFAYSTPSDLYILGPNGKQLAALQSCQGVRQGDPLSSLLFALVIQPIYAGVAERHPGVIVTAFLDDCTLEGQPTLFCAAYTDLTDASATIGLDVQSHKSKLVFFHHSTHPIEEALMIAAFLQQHGIPVHLDSAVLLGAPVYRTVQAARDSLEAVLVDQRGVLECLRHSQMPVQEAVQVLRQSTMHKLDYIMRCVRPEVAEPCVLQYHDAVMTFLFEKLDLSSAMARLGREHREATLLQLHLPIRQGGIGIPNITQLYHISYLLSLASTVHRGLSLNVFDRYDSPPSLSPTTQLYRQVHASLHALRTQATRLGEDGVELRQLLPGTVEEFFRQFSPHTTTSGRDLLSLQQALPTYFNHAAGRRLGRLVSASGSAWHSARLATCRAEGAGRWLTVVGSDPERILRDDSYRMAVRLRLGLPPMDVMTSHCHSCRAPIIAADAPLLKQDMWHWLGCTNGVAGAALQQRHNRVRNLLRDHVLRAKGIAQLEPTNLGNDNKRPDLLVTFRGTQYILDVAVIHQLAYSHLVRRGSPMLAKEQEKIRKYKAMARQQQMDFVPFIMDTSGGLGPAAVKFLQKLSVHSRDLNGAWSQAEIDGRLRDTLAVAIQDGNWRIVHSSYLNAARGSRR
jgi:hypothetical protein